jgi:cytochrome c6
MASAEGLALRVGYTGCVFHFYFTMKKILALSLLVTLVASAGSVGHAAPAKENWDNLCAKCHAEDGSGGTKMGKKLKIKDYTDAKVQALFTDEQAVKITTDGVTKDGKDLMKGFKDDLKPDEVQALVAYIRTMKK